MNKNFRSYVTTQIGEWDSSRLVAILLSNRGWFALFGASGALASIALLHRRRRQCQEANRKLQSEGRSHVGTNGAPLRFGEVNRSPPVGKGSHSRNLSGTFAWNEDGVDIGAALGVDIGGTLSKLVYFEKKAPPAAACVRQRSEDPMGKKVEMKRAVSLGNLHETTENQQALKEFYSFMDQASKLGDTGVRDRHLSAYSHALGGVLHFFHFETRFMDDAVEMVSKSRVHRNIQALGCTGGGAFKFECFFLERLGVKMLKMDEMECLVRGMQFALANIPEECFTYRPPSQTEGRSDSEEMVDEEETAGHQDPSAGPEWKDSWRNKRMREITEGAEKRSYPPFVHSSNVIFRVGSRRETEFYCIPHDAHPSLLDDLLEHVPFQMHISIKFCRWNAAIAEHVKYGINLDKTRTRLIAYVMQEYSVKVVRAMEDDPIEAAYPALVVSVGSGVSIIKVDGPADFKRVSGSSIGGGTYWGLCRLLTAANTYDESLEMASRGDSNIVDMLVGDIYGRGYSKFQLSSNTLASSFGKIGGMKVPKGKDSGVGEADIARALLVMISLNIGQVAYLNAKLFDTRRIYFVGNFLRHNHLSGRQLAFAIDYWSSGEMEALFLEHEGYLGALGSFLMSGTEEPIGSGCSTPSSMAAKEDN